MNKKIGIIVLIIILLVGGFFVYSKNGVKAANTVSNKEMVKITHRKGETEVPKNPEKVIVLDYGTIDVMEALGKEPIALPKASLPSYLEKYKDDKYSDLGSLKEFDIEKINELKPELIVIEGRQEKFYEELSKIAPTIMLGTDGSDHFGSLEKNVDIIGKIYEMENVTDSKLQDIKTRMESINKKIKEENKTALITMVSEGNISVFGPGSRFGSIYDKFGFASADDKIEVSNHGQNISYEYLVTKNPDLLFVVDKGVVAGGDEKPAKDVVENDLTKTTNAYKNGKIIYLNPQAWYVGGSGLMATDTMITEIENAMK